MISSNNGLPELPANWVWSTVGEVYDIVGGGTPSTSVSEYWTGNIPWITSADIHGPKDVRPRKRISATGVSNSTTNLVPAGSLIVVTRVGLGKVAIAPDQLCFSQDSQALVGFGDLLDAKFALYYLSTAVQIFKYQNRGTTISGVTKKQLAELPFPIAPLCEQKRIVQKIEELLTQLEAAVDELSQAQAQLKRYRRAVLKAAVTGELTREWREAHENELEPASELLVQILKDRRRSWGEGVNSGKPKQNYREPRTLETTDRPGLPSLWIWASLESVGEAIAGYAFKSKLFSEHGKHQVVKMANIKMGILDLSERPAFVDDADPEVLKKFSLRSGDLLVTLTGTRKKRDYGFVVTLEQPTRSLLLNQRIARLRPYRPILPRYLQIVMQDPVYRDRFFSHETGNVGQGNVGMAAITVEPVAIAPLAEQHKIVSEFERLTSIIHALEQTIDLAFKKADRVRQSILKDAFEGKLVPQDPNDEPAELLLERIKLERAKREAEKQADLKSNRKRSTKKRPNRTERPAA